MSERLDERGAAVVLVVNSNVRVGQIRMLTSRAGVGVRIAVAGHQIGLAGCTRTLTSSALP